MRILHMIPDIGISNGVMSVILNYAKAMPVNVIFDVVYFKETEKNRKGDIEALGGHVYKISSPSPKTALKREMDSFFKAHKGEWTALHINAPHFTVFIAPAAKRAGIKKIFCHCHSTWYSLKPENEKRNKILNLPTKQLVNCQFACGRDAGRFWYGSDENFVVLPNAVNCNNLRFNEKVRNDKREELELNGKFVVGHIGRLYPPQKNHPFLLEIFAHIKQKKDNAVLLLVGAEEDEKLINKAKQLDIEENVCFLGPRKDISQLLQAMDVFVFPSFKEGLPVAVVEAQAAGLPVFMSDSITDEVMITNNIKALSLSMSAKYWSDEILKYEACPRSDTYFQMKESGWDIVSAADKLYGYYNG